MTEKRVAVTHTLKVRLLPETMKRVAGEIKMSHSYIVNGGERLE